MQAEIRSEKEDRKKSNDDLFFSNIMIKYGDSLTNVAYNVVYCIDDAKDIVQDSLISFYSNRNSFRGDSSIYTYLYRIVLNKSIDFLRKKKNKNNFFVNIEKTEALCEDNNHDTKIVVRDALKKLDIKYRVPLILLEYENKSYEEIAEILKITLGNVKIKIFRAREELLKILKKMGVTNVRM